MISEDLDLAEVTAFLREKLFPGGPLGYLRGKATMRDLLVRDRGFSELQAEELIDTLETRGFLHFLGNTQERSEVDASWEIR